MSRSVRHPVVGRLTLFVLALALVAPPATFAANAASPDVPSDVTFAWAATIGSAPQPGFARPTGIDVGSDGNIYISDATRNDIQGFTPGGAFVRKVGVAGSGPGQFRDPADVAARGDKLYVADRNNARVQVLDSQGALLASVDGRQHIPGSMSVRLPTRVDADGAGRVFLLNYSDQQLYRYSPGGVLERRYEANCIGAGHEGLAVLSSGVAFCSAAYGGVWRVPLDGPAVQFKGEAPGQPPALGQGMSLTAAPDDTVWAYRNESNTRASPPVNLFVHLAADGALLGQFPVSGDMLDIAASADRIFALTNARRVRVYNWTGQVLGEWGGDAFAGSTAFEKPDRIAAAPDGTFYVLERERKRLRHLSANGDVLAVLAPNERQGNLAMPIDLAVDGLNRVYALDGDPWNEDYLRIVRFANDRFDTVLPLSVVYPTLHGATAIAVTGDSVVVMSGPRIFHMDLSGRRIAEARTFDGDFTSLLDAALVPGKRIARVYSGQPAVRIVDFTGKELMYWGVNKSTDLTQPIRPGLFVYPTGIASDLRGRVFIVDTEQTPYIEGGPTYSSRVQVFDESGSYLTAFGGYGNQAGQFVLPQAVAALADGRIIVADTGNNRLQVFAPIGPLPPQQPLPGPAQYGQAGPLRVASWQDEGPRGVGKINSILIPPQPSAARPILGIYGGGLAKSLDGATWERQASKWPGGELQYAGTQTLFASGRPEDAPYRSKDLGKTWQRLGDAPVASSRKAFAISPYYEADHTLFIGTLLRGLWRSTDDGETWQTRGDPTQTYYELAVLPAANGARVLLADGCCKPSGILRSVDDGATWQLVRGGSTNGFAVSPAFAQDQTVFIADGTNPGALRSVDGGQTWQTVGAATGRPWRRVSLSPSYGADKTLILWDYASPESFISRDGGDTWSPLTMAGQPSNLWLVFAPDYAITGAIWRQRFQGAGGIEVTTDSGASWKPLGTAPGAAILSLAAPASIPQELWATIADGVIALPGGSGASAFVYKFPYVRFSAHIGLALSPAFETDGTAIAETAMTKDGGATWQPLPFAPEMEWAASAQGSSQAAAFSPHYASDGVALITFDDYPSEPLSALRRTSDRGATWQSGTVPVGSVRAIVFDAGNSKRVYAGGEGGVAVSLDGGATWQRVSEPLSLLSVRSLVTRVEGGAAVVYAATTSAGMWRSADRGDTWTPFNAGLGDGYLGAAAGNDEVFAAATRAGQVYLLGANGVWERAGGPLSGEVNDLLVQGTVNAGRITVATSVGVWSAALPVGEPKRIWAPLVGR